MKKKLIIIVILILLLLIVSAISLRTFLYNDYSHVNAEVSDIMKNIVTSLDNELPPMLDLEESNLEESYGIEVDKLEQYAIKVPIMNIRADELVILKVKYSKDIDYVMSKINDRVKVLQNNFEGYLEDQYELTKSPLIIKKGKYILMSISERNDDIEVIFNSYF